ncbi:MAG: hypothetical protein PWR07_2253 [Bacillota bacterium]|nr:hypothetical protein [Bacillota bacterium]
MVFLTICGRRPAFRSHRREPPLRLQIPQSQEHSLPLLDVPLPAPLVPLWRNCRTGTWLMHIANLRLERACGYRVCNRARRAIESPGGWGFITNQVRDHSNDSAHAVPARTLCRRARKHPAGSSLGTYRFGAACSHARMRRPTAGVGMVRVILAGPACKQTWSRRNQPSARSGPPGTTPADLPRRNPAKWSTGDQIPHEEGPLGTSLAHVLIPS